MAQALGLGAGFKALVPTLAIIYGGQAVASVPAIAYKTEKFYDLTGSLGFFSGVAASLYSPYLTRRFIQGDKSAILPNLRSFAPRQLIASALVVAWAARLGSFLALRIQKSGKDERFDEIKQSPVKFFGAWMAQATWITLTALPVWLINVLPAKAHPALGIVDVAALGLWAAGWGLEIVADRQKSAWREAQKAGKHDEKFISSGTWSVSRHPNYAGEVTLWSAQFLLSVRALSSSSSVGILGPAPVLLGLAAVGPLFEYSLIRFASGVPLLEKGMDKKLGDE
ncbi:DUF1295-domain-containing protein [Ceraceosorus guamensis]|uniref:DUF1295-domain-containing protein n=1 Tax=Ceraceosorus guamensis TaxID=1522189 RepID=A0A316VTU5_9BASI|nr:DUF1295-domain-containing protein [Ceraceosorus guamensis]PWN40624.1 DUF1295-domain-containing protein [Ceraceosorus guamensis]